jgi:hypothetical protein
MMHVCINGVRKCQFCARFMVLRKTDNDEGYCSTTRMSLPARTYDGTQKWFGRDEELSCFKERRRRRNAVQP